MQVPSLEGLASSSTWEPWLPQVFRELVFRKGCLTKGAQSAVSFVNAQSLSQPGALDFMLIHSLRCPQDGKHMEMNSYLS